MSDLDLSGFTLENGQFVTPAVLNTPLPSRRSPSTTPFRFLQASDFCLDTPCYGVTSFPEGYRERFVDARFLAARHVFDAAIEHNVDFIVLAGGLLDVDLPGLRGPWFLAEQFRRLADHGIDVYWAGATLETRGRWPSHVAMPPNVHRLCADQTGILHGRDGQPIARLVALSEAKDVPRVPSTNGFTIAVQPRCTTEPEQLPSGIDYWALGGQSDHETVQIGKVVAHFAGSPQGRSPREVGRHSCSLVNVDSAGDVHIQPIPTDVVRWHHRRIDVDSATSWDQLKARLEAELSDLPADDNVELALVTWTVTGSGLTLERLLHPQFNADLTSHMNAQSTDRSPVVWNLGIETVVEPSQLADWQQQDTPLGAFLRELEDMSEHVPEMFGAATNRSHAPGPHHPASLEQILDRVINEGVHWLGSDTHIAERAV